MNQDDNLFKLKFTSAHEAFGSNLNDDDDSDMPFRNYQKAYFYRLFL
jgi:replicative DNA helicase